MDKFIAKSLLILCLALSSAEVSFLDPNPIELTTSSTPIVSDDCIAKRSVKGFDVILMMGQSNMSGRGIGFDSTLDGRQDARIRQWSRWSTRVAASEPLQHDDWYYQILDRVWHHSSWRVGMGTSFARSYLATLPSNRSVLLVPTAFGGTTLVKGPWSPGGPFFEGAMHRVKHALRSDAGNCMAAVLWHQGEQDNIKGVSTSTYEAALDNMIYTMRQRVPRTAKAPFVLGEFAPSWSATVSNEVLLALQDTPSRVTYTALAPSQGLTSNPTELFHFDAPSMRTLGERYFAALEAALGNTS
jgi:hypothetical protein